MSHSRDLSRSPAAAGSGTRETVHGHEGLQLEELLLFEIDNPGATGVDLPEPGTFTARLGGLERQGEIGLPSVSEPEVVRHFHASPRKTMRSTWAPIPWGRAP